MNETATAAVQNPAFLAGEALGSSFRRLFRIISNQKHPTTLQFRKIRAVSTPDQRQYKFLDYAITNWAPHTKYITRKSSVWEKFERLATCFNETWNFHPWELGGRSPRSHLHSLFGWAVKGQHEPLLSIALSSKRDIMHVCNIPLVGESLPALHVASNLRDYEMVKILLGICNVNLQDEEGYTPLHHAAGKGHTTIARLLSSTKGVNVDVASKSHGTPLCLAASNGYEEIVLLLIERGANLEARVVASGQTPLSQAAGNGHYAVVELLIGNGAKLEVRDTDGRTPLSWAIQNGHETIMKLLEKGANSAEPRPRRPPSPRRHSSQSVRLSSAQPSPARTSSLRRPSTSRGPPRDEGRPRPKGRPRPTARGVLPTVNESEPLPPR